MAAFHLRLFCLLQGDPWAAAGQCSRLQAAWGVAWEWLSPSRGPVGEKEPMHGSCDPYVLYRFAMVAAYLRLYVLACFLLKAALAECYPDLVVLHNRPPLLLATIWLCQKLVVATCAKLELGDEDLQSRLAEMYNLNHRFHIETSGRCIATKRESCA